MQKKVRWGRYKCYLYAIYVSFIFIEILVQFLLQGFGSILAAPCDHWRILIYCNMQLLQDN
jgi:hypothetical protein